MNNQNIVNREARVRSVKTTVEVDELELKIGDLILDLRESTRQLCLVYGLATPKNTLPPSDADACEWVKTALEDLSKTVQGLASQARHEGHNRHVP